MMYYTYVLLSNKDGKFYTGYTKDLKIRFDQHVKGQVPSTKDRRPLACISHKNRHEETKSAVDTRHIVKGTRRHTVCMLRMLLVM